LTIAFLIAVFLNVFFSAVAGFEPRKNIVWTVVWIYLSIESWKDWRWKALLPYPLYFIASILLFAAIFNTGADKSSWAYIIVGITANIGGLAIFSYMLLRERQKKAGTLAFAMPEGTTQSLEQSEADACSINGNDTSGSNSPVSHNQEDKFMQGAPANSKLLGSAHHPWRRLFARFIDSFGWGLVLFSITFSMFKNSFGNGFIAVVLLIPLLLILLEAVFLSTAGNTLGKWLYGIAVRTTSSQKLSFSQALSRSFRVALQGAGLGIPFVSFFTQIFAYRRLIRTGTTLWDTATGSVVSHKKWGAARAISCSLIVLLVFVLTSVANYYLQHLTSYLDSSRVLSIPEKSSEEFDFTKPYKVISTPESSTAEWLSKAVKLEIKKDWPGLLKYALRWTQAQPGDAFAWNSLGLAYKETGQTAKGIETLQQAVRIDPESVLAWNGLGNAYGESNQPAKAIEAFQQAIRINPEHVDAEAWYNFGLAYSNSSQPAKAIEAYQQALRINPEDAYAWNNLGVAYGDTAQPAKEIEACQQALRINPEYAKAWYNIGHAYKITGQTNQVMEVYKRLKTLDPAIADKFFNKFVLP